MNKLTGQLCLWKFSWVWIVVLFTAQIAAQQTSEPDDLFSNYAVSIRFHGQPAKPVLTDEAARNFRTRIKIGAAQGPVFADHYGIAVWGCGTGCIEFAIIDSISGKVSVFPYSVSQVREAGERLTYRRNSSAIHVIGALNEENSADRWYLWDGKKFKLIQEKPARLVDDSP